MNLKKNKIGNNLIEYIVIAIIIYSIFVVLSLVGIQKIFITSKATDLETYLEGNAQNTVAEFIQYSYDNGYYYYIVPVDKKTSESEYINSQKFTDDMHRTIDTIEYQVSGPEATLILPDVQIRVAYNPNVIKDFMQLIKVVYVISFIVFVAILFFINHFINKRVVKPLDKVSKYIQGIQEFDYHQKKPKLKYKDELKDVVDVLEELSKTISVEMINRNQMLRAITHEFRTPLSHITTILYLHKTKVKGYREFEQIEKEINDLVQENQELITNTLKSLEVNSLKLREKIDINQMIHEKIKLYEVYNVNKDVDIDINKLIVKKNLVSVNLIINNILLNASKYSKNYIRIYQLEKNVLIIENDYEKVITKGYGRELINNISEYEKIKIIENHNIENKYQTKIIF